MQVQSDPPCNGAPTIATLQLSFPQGGSEHDIQLTYAEAGTPPDSTVVLSGNVNFVDSCGSGVPSSYTFAVQNVGNVRAYPKLHRGRVRVSRGRLWLGNRFGPAGWDNMD